jgi:hypothetical protein
MKMHWLINTAIALATLTLPIGGVMAETLAEQPFSEYGVVDDGAQQGVLIVSDTIFHLGDQVVIQKLDGHSANARDLKPGTKIGFNIYGPRTDQYISEIWILPTSFDLTSTGPVPLPGSGPANND